MIFEFFTEASLVSPDGDMHALLDDAVYTGQVAVNWEDLIDE